MKRSKIITITCCDDCGDEVDPDNSTETFWISKLHVNVASANIGESAVLCKDCYTDSGEAEHQ